MHFSAGFADCSPLRISFCLAKVERLLEWFGVCYDVNVVMATKI